MPPTGSKLKKFSTSLRACTSIHRIDGSTAIRSITACTLIAPRCRPIPGISEPGVSSTTRGPRRPSVGIEFERARDHRRRGHAAAAVADHDDLVGGVGARDLDETPGAGLDRAIEAGRLAAGVFQQIRPMAVDLHHEAAVGQRPQQLEATERRGDADDDGDDARRAEKPRRQR